MSQLYSHSIKITDEDGTAKTANVDGHSPIRLYNIQNSTGYEYTHNASGYWHAKAPAGLYKIQTYGSGGYEDDTGLTEALSGGHEGLWIGPSVRMYTKRHVQITGTMDSAQTITTGSSPLASPDDEKWNAYPSDWTAITEFLIFILPEQEMRVVETAARSVSSGNIVLSVAQQGMGDAYGDGNVYATIVIVDLR